MRRAEHRTGEAPREHHRLLQQRVRAREQRVLGVVEEGYPLSAERGSLTDTYGGGAVGTGVCDGEAVSVDSGQHQGGGEGDAGMSAVLRCDEASCVGNRWR